MALFEHIIMLRQDLSTSDLENILKIHEEAISELNGNIVYKESWGLRNLAYPIKKNVKGIYQNLYFESNGKAIKEIEYFERYNDKIMKFLSIKLKKLPKEDSQLKSNK